MLAKHANVLGILMSINLLLEYFMELDKLTNSIYLSKNVFSFAWGVFSLYFLTLLNPPPHCKDKV